MDDIATQVIEDLQTSTTEKLQDEKEEVGVVEYDGQVFPLRCGENVLGRDSKCDIVVSSKDGSVSKRHAVVSASNNTFFIHDLGSLNGTYIANNKLTPEVRYAVNEKSDLRLGTVQIIIRDNLKAEVEHTDYDSDEPLLSEGDLIHAANGVKNGENGDTDFEEEEEDQCTQFDEETAELGPSPQLDGSVAGQSEKREPAGEQQVSEGNILAMETQMGTASSAATNIFEMVTQAAPKAADVLGAETQIPTESVLNLETQAPQFAMPASRSVTGSGSMLEMETQMLPPGSSVLDVETQAPAFATPGPVSLKEGGDNVLDMETQAPAFATPGPVSRTGGGENVLDMETQAPALTTPGSVSRTGGGENILDMETQAPAFATPGPVSRTGGGENILDMETQAPAFATPGPVSRTGGGENILDMETQAPAFITPGPVSRTGGGENILDMETQAPAFATPGPVSRAGGGENVLDVETQAPGFATSDSVSTPSHKEGVTNILEMETQASDSVAVECKSRSADNILEIDTQLSVSVANILEMETQASDSVTVESKSGATGNIFEMETQAPISAANILEMETQAPVSVIGGSKSRSGERNILEMDTQAPTLSSPVRSMVAPRSPDSVERIHTILTKHTPSQSPLLRPSAAKTLIPISPADSSITAPSGASILTMETQEPTTEDSCDDLHLQLTTQTPPKSGGENILEMETQLSHPQTPGTTLATSSNIFALETQPGFQSESATPEKEEEALSPAGTTFHTPGKSSQLGCTADSFLTAQGSDDPQDVTVVEQELGTQELGTQEVVSAMESDCGRRNSSTPVQSSRLATTVEDSEEEESLILETPAKRMKPAVWVPETQDVLEDETLDEDDDEDSSMVIPESQEIVETTPPSSPVAQRLTVRSCDPFEEVAVGADEPAEEQEDALQMETQLAPPAALQAEPETDEEEGEETAPEQVEEEVEMEAVQEEDAMEMETQIAPLAAAQSPARLETISAVASKVQGKVGLMLPATFNMATPPLKGASRQPVIASDDLSISQMETQIAPAEAAAPSMQAPVDQEDASCVEASSSAVPEIIITAPTPKDIKSRKSKAVEATPVSTPSSRPQRRLVTPARYKDEEEPTPSRRRTATPARHKEVPATPLERVKKGKTPHKGAAVEDTPEVSSEAAETSAEAPHQDVTDPRDSDAPPQQNDEAIRASHESHEDNLPGEESADSKTVEPATSVDQVDAPQLESVVDEPEVTPEPEVKEVKSGRGRARKSTLTPRATSAEETSLMEQEAETPKPGRSRARKSAVAPRAAPAEKPPQLGEEEKAEVKEPEISPELVEGAAKPDQEEPRSGRARKSTVAPRAVAEQHEEPPQLEQETTDEPDEPAPELVHKTPGRGRARKSTVALKAVPAEEPPQLEQEAEVQEPEVVPEPVKETPKPVEKAPTAGSSRVRKSTLAPKDVPAEKPEAGEKEPEVVSEPVKETPVQKTPTAGRSRARKSTVTPRDIPAEEQDAEVKETEIISEPEKPAPKPGRSRARKSAVAPRATPSDEPPQLEQEVARKEPEVAPEPAETVPKRGRSRARKSTAVPRAVSPEPPKLEQEAEEEKPEAPKSGRGRAQKPKVPKIAVPPKLEEPVPVVSEPEDSAPRRGKGRKVTTKSAESSTPAPPQATEEPVQATRGRKRRETSSSFSTSPERTKRAAKSEKPVAEVQPKTTRRGRSAVEESESQDSQISRPVRGRRAEQTATVSQEPPKITKGSRAAAKKASQEQEDSQASQTIAAASQEPPKTTRGSKRAAGKKVEALQEQEDSQASQTIAEASQEPPKTTRGSKRAAGRKVEASQEQTDSQTSQMMTEASQEPPKTARGSKRAAGRKVEASQEQEDSQASQTIAEASQQPPKTARGSKRSTAKKVETPQEQEDSQTIPKRQVKASQQEVKPTAPAAATRKQGARFTAVEEDGDSDSSVASRRSERRGRGAPADKKKKVEEPPSSSVSPVRKSSRSKHPSSRLIESIIDQEEIVGRPRAPRAEPESPKAPTVGKRGGRTAPQVNSQPPAAESQPARGKQQTRGRKRKSDGPEEEEPQEKARCSEVFDQPGTKPGAKSGSQRGARDQLSSSSSASTSKTDTQTEHATRHHQATKVMFSGFVSHAAQSKLLQQLGGKEVELTPAQESVLVMQRLVRTLKLFTVLARGMPVVGEEWVTLCVRAGQFLDPWEHLILGDIYEDMPGLTVRVCLEERRRLGHPVLQGWSVMPTSSIRPTIEDFTVLVESAGGTVLRSAPKVWPARSLIVTTPEDQALWAKLQGGRKAHKPKLLPLEAIFKSILRNAVITEGLELGGK